MEENKTISKLWEDYEHARIYQKELNLTVQIPLNVDFYEGRQWPAKTESTKNIPRPIVNIVKFIVRNKKSSIVGSPVSIVFTSNRNPEMAQKLTEFNKTIENEMSMDDLRNRKVQEGIIKGTSIVHYYWDAEARGEIGDFEGGVRGEIIDPLNVFFANPQERDEQKQKWIIIAARVEVDAAKAMMSEKYRRNGGINRITPDNAESNYTDEHEQDGTELCTVLTRYYRKDGEVFYERAVKGVMLHDGIPMTPPTEFELEEIEDKNIGNDINSDKKSIDHNYREMDDGEDKLQDVPKKHRNRERKRFTLYPISVYSYEPREKSIYGIGEVEEIIPNQKALNFIFSMQLLSIQNLAWGKWVVKKGALGNQKLTNSPGQVITDHTPYGVKGIQRTDEPAISNAPMDFVNNLISVTRVVTGSTEVMTGEAQTSGQSGQAIANLQSQALKPIQELRDRYLRSCKKEAKIIKQFYELFYDGKRFEYKTKDEQFVEEEFSGDEMQDVIFDISIEAGSGTPYSETLTISLLTEYLSAGYIDYETYLELLPAQIASFKSTLLKKVKEGSVAQLKQAQEQIAALQEQITQYQSYIQQIAVKMKEQGKTVEQVNRIISENRKLNATLAQLQTEYTAKINQANAANVELAKQNDAVTKDAQLMALMMADADNNGQ